MKTKKYRHGKYAYRAYLKNVGHGYEVGFLSGSTVLFTGNFIKSTEANQWWTKMNQEIAKFAKRYWATEETSKTFYNKFIKNHLNSCYFTFVNKLVAKHNREAQRAFNKDLRNYKRLKKNWEPSEKLTLKRAA